MHGRSPYGNVMIRSAARFALGMARGGVRVLLASTLVVFAPTAARAELPPPVRRAVDLYLQELARVEQSGERLSMEPLFVRADSLDDYLFPSELSQSIEGLPGMELDSLQAALRGVTIVMSDYVFTYLDDDFFQKIAESKGLPQDREFLKAYAGRDLGSESVQDCTHFGADLLVNQHGAWRQFKARYPRDYVRFAADEDGNVIGQLLSTCACGDSSSVDSEFRRFLRLFPKDPIAPQIRSRLDSLQKGTSGITFNCPPPHYH